MKGLVIVAIEATSCVRYSNFVVMNHREFERLSRSSFQEEDVRRQTRAQKKIMRLLDPTLDSGCCDHINISSFVEVEELKVQK